ncbi:MAG: ASKHA domain-containing protein [Promethearchaeota archaeon]
MEIQNENILIDFEPISRRIYYLDKTFYDILLKINVPVQSLCGGSGSCGKCKILIEKGNEFLIPPTNEEKNLLSEKELDNGWRLACRTKIDNKYLKILEKIEIPQFRIFLPEEFLLEDFKILTSGTIGEISLNPSVKKIYLEVEKPTLEKPISDFERVLYAIKKRYSNQISNENLHIDIDLLNNLSRILRENDHKITITIWNEKKIIDVEPGNLIDHNYGVAFDIGTTTLVGYLMNLNNGKIYSLASKLNQQTAFGEDLITRITYIKNHEEGLQKLNSAVLEGLNDIILKICNKAKIQPTQIYEATIVGNSVMHHIFLGLNPTNIGLSPYVPLVQKGLNFNSKDVDLNICKRGNVYTAPLIAGFVGADTMGVILSSNIEKETDLTLAIDIGTNGELIIGNQEIMATGSCAAGSALEGAHIKDGMRAAAGAIERIKIDPDTLEVTYTTIKNKKPIGICGSGLVDAIAEMLKAKILMRSGNFNLGLIDNERLVKKDNKLEFIIAKKEETSIGREISLTQNDIRQMQMAKAAFYSGMRIILKELRLFNGSMDLEIKQIFLAGAFGNYIDKENAKFIGMIPDIPNEKIFQIGNAAGTGAQICLLNRDFRKIAQEILGRIKYVEIATKKAFQREYAEAMYFPHLNLEFFPSLTEYNNIPKR